jgi:hypothetical protein
MRSDLSHLISPRSHNQFPVTKTYCQRTNPEAHLSKDFGPAEERAGWQRAEHSKIHYG